MRTKLLISVGFAVAFAAGLVGGWQGHRLGGHGDKPEVIRDPRRGPSLLTRELGLSDQQQEQLQKIWSEAGNRGDQDEHRRQVRKLRDETIVSLIPTSQQSSYEAAQKDYADAMTAIDDEAKKNFQNAVDRTRQILTPEQAKKYDAMLARNPWGRPGREQGRGGPGGKEPSGPPEGPPREGHPGPRPPATEPAPPEPK